MAHDSLSQAAAVKGASPIIAIDCVPAKLELAKTIGATHIVNTAEPNADSVQKVRDLTGGIGASIVIEATGVVPVMSSAINMAAPLGRIILVGLPVGNPKLELPILDLIGVRCAETKTRKLYVLMNESRPESEFKGVLRAM